MAQKFTVRRRSFVSGVAASLVSAGAMREADAQPLSDQLRLNDPYAPMSLYARLHGSESDAPSIWSAKSVYYGQLDNSAPVPILGAEELNFVTVNYNGSDRLTEVSDKVMYFQDLETNAVLTHWRNVFTGETLDLTRPLITTTTEIENNRMRAEERSSYVKIDRQGTLQMPFLQGNILTVANEQFATFTAAALEDAADHRGDRKWWSGIWSSFSANVEDVVRRGDNFVPCHGQTFGGAPWYSWLKMADRAGTSSMRRFFTKHPNISDVPPHLVAWAQRNHPAFLPRIRE